MVSNKCIGFYEYDKFVIASYITMHIIKLITTRTVDRC
jgi:hypothetical protein